MSEIINLNVGGKLYTTTRETLTRLKGTMLEAMFSGRHVVKEVDGRYFIDRDGKLFRYILAYLRDSEEWVPPREEELPVLMKEARYFGIDPLVKMLEEMPNEEMPNKETTVSSFVIAVSDHSDLSIITNITDPPLELETQFRLITWYTHSTIPTIIVMCQKAGYDLIGSVISPGESPPQRVYMSFRRRD